MTTFTTRTISCPICKHRFERELQTGFNTEQDGDDFVKVFEDDYFDQTCPHYGETFVYEHDILVYNPESHVMIQFLSLDGVMSPKGNLGEFDNLVDAKYREFLELKEKNLIPQAVQYRTVFDIYDILEKLSIFSLGFDDRAIELTKVATLGFYNSQCKESKVDHLRLSLEQDEEDEKNFFVRFLAFNDDEFVDEINFVEELYKDFETKARDYYAEGTLIDSNWALSTLMNLQNALLKEIDESIES